MMIEHDLEMEQDEKPRIFCEVCYWKTRVQSGWAIRGVKIRMTDVGVVGWMGCRSYLILLGYEKINDQIRISSPMRRQMFRGLQVLVLLFSSFNLVVLCRIGNLLTHSAPRGWPGIKPGSRARGDSVVEHLPGKRKVTISNPPHWVDFWIHRFSILYDLIKFKKLNRYDRKHRIIIQQDMNVQVVSKVQVSVRVLTDGSSLP